MRPGDFVELLEERMRKTVIFAAAGLAIGLTASVTNAMTSTSPAGLRAATEALSNSALVHCRPYRHWHPWGYGTGCHGGGVSVEIERGHRRGVGVEERERSSIHSRTTTRGETSVRGSRSTTTGETSSKSGTSTTSKSRTSTDGSTGRAQTGEKSSGGGSSGGSMSGSSGGTTGSQTGQKQ